MSAGTERHPQIRAVVAADVPGLHALADECWDLEPQGRGELIDLVLDRPGQPEALRLVAVDGDLVVGAAVASCRDDTGTVDAIAVSRPWRRRGVASLLLTSMELRLRDMAARRVTLGGSMWWYVWPGIDERYRAAISLAARLGYRQVGTATNMVVDLERWRPDIVELPPERAPGCAVRRARHEDRDELVGFVRTHFDEPWPHEAALALDRERPSVFLAHDAETLLGFACHGVYRRDWFGPIGTAAAARGRGVGEALLARCLRDLAATGLHSADIAWIGPRAFYERTVSARPGRLFRQYAKELAP